MVYIVLGIISILSTLASLSFVTAKFILRKRHCAKSGDIEVFKQRELTFFALYFSAILFGIILIILGLDSIKINKQAVPADMGILAFCASIFLSCFAAVISVKRIVITKDCFIIHSPLFLIPMTFETTMITRAYITHNKITLVNGDSELFSANVTAKNIRFLKNLLDDLKIPKIFPQISANINRPFEKFVVKMPLKDKLLLPAIFAFAAVLFTFCSLQVFYSAFIFVGAAIVSGIISCYFILLALRLKIVVNRGKMVYTPIFGKKRSYLLGDIMSINVADTGFIGGRSRYMLYISIYFKKGRKIRRIPFGFIGVQELLEAFKGIAC